MKYLSKIIISLFICTFVLSGFLYFIKSNLEKQINFQVDISKKDISEILRKISAKDKKRLEYFFRQFFVTNLLGYVLFGEKPCAINSYQEFFFASKKKKKSIVWSFFVPSNLKFRKSYKTWIKYQNLFPLSNFVIKEEINPWAKESIFVIILNKKLFITTVKENIHDFEKVLNRKIIPEELWKEALEKPLLADVLRLHDGLIGTLLGFGRDNSWKFHEEKLFSYKSTLKNPWENNNVYQEINNSLQSIGFFDQFIGNYTQDMKLTFLPAFKAIADSSETTQLINKYIDSRRKMLDFYQGKDFLETTLRLLTTSKR